MKVQKYSYSSPRLRSFVLCFVIFKVCSCALCSFDEQSHVPAYDNIDRNLGFENKIVPPWTGISQINYVGFDSIVYAEGRYSAVITNNAKPGADNSTLLKQRFYITEKTKNIDFSIYYRTLSKWNLTLAINGYDEAGNLKFEQSQSFTAENNEEWKYLKISKNDIPSVEYIEISLEAMFQYNSDCFVCQLWLDKAEVHFDDIPIIKYEFPPMKKNIFYAEEIGSFKVQCDLNFDELNLRKNKKILGIGETTHGSKELNKFALECLKHSIQKNNTTVLILELANELVLNWDLFVNNKADFPIESLVEYNMLFDKTAFADFLYWLRDFNLKNNMKVRLIGMDIPSGKKQEYLLLYLHCLKQDYLIKEIIKLYEYSMFSLKSIIFVYSKIVSL